MISLGGRLGVARGAAAAAGTGVLWPRLAALAVICAPLDGGHERVLLGEVLNDTTRYALVGDVAVRKGGRCSERQRKEDEALADGRHWYFYKTKVGMKRVKAGRVQTKEEGGRAV